jgi:mannose-1-phosphate guanylyltransferase
MPQHIVIMAGGKGERLWPLSREGKPKQLLSLGGEKTLLRKTFERVQPLVLPQQIYVVTGSDISEQVRKELPELPKENILVEPFPKNTAPCIGYAATVIAQKNPQAIMVVLPADHSIADEEGFRRALRFGFASLEQHPEFLITLGIVPDHAETGYGYIAPEQPICGRDGFSLRKVKAFHEKPDAKKAKKYIQEGYFWNSGMFLWRVDVILREFGAYLPLMHEHLLALNSTLNRDRNAVTDFYKNVEAISIDYGIMEKAKDVAVIPASFGWSDIGSWDSIGKILPHDAAGNTVQGDVVSYESANNVVWATEKKLMLIGVEDMVVVEGEEAILVCPRERSQDVSTFLKKMKKEF